MPNIQSAGKLEILDAVGTTDLSVLHWETPQEGSSWLIEQLISKSRQPHILASTPKDADERFESFSTYSQWSVSGKLLVAIVDEAEHDLAGIIWFGQKTNELAPNCPTTFAIRLYEGYLRKGLGRPFMAAAHTVLEKTVEYPFANVWLDTDAENASALKLYDSFGYIKVDETEQGRVVMTYTV